MPPSATKGRSRKTVASLDAEAAERRRTQLRVAQRAFRKRREATTEELREQVNELQSVHDGLLSSIRDTLNNTSVNERDSALAQALENLLAKYSSPQDGDKGEDGKATVPAAEQHIDKARGSLQISDSDLVVTSDISHLSNVTASSRGGTLNTIDTSYNIGNSLFDHGLPFNLFWTTPNDLPELLQPLQPFGYDEAPFSIRLRRRGIQAGYQLCTNRWRAPRAYERVFRWPLLQGTDEGKMLQFFLNKMVASASQLQETALMNINWSSIPEVDPEAIPGLEDSWLFPADVEAYLARKGVNIDPGVWFVSTRLKRDSICNPSSALNSQPDVEPLYHAILERYCSPVDDVFLADDAPVLPCVTPTMPTQPAINVAPLPLTGFHVPSIQDETLALDPLLFGLQDYSWMSQDCLPDDTHIVFGSPSLQQNIVMPNNMTITPSQDTSVQFGQSVLPMSSDQQTHNLSKDDNRPALSSMPSMYTDSTASASTPEQEQQQEDTLVDVTLDITQLMSNLLLSVSCLGWTQAYKKADIDRALRASVLLHTF